MAEVQITGVAVGLFNATEPKPNADFIFIRLFRADRAHQTQSQQAGGSSCAWSEMKELNNETSICDRGFLSCCV